MRFIHSHLELDTPMISFHGSLITDPSGKNPEFKLENKFIEKKVMIDLIEQLDLFDISTSTHLIGIDKAIEINDVKELHELDFDVYEGVIMAETDNDIDRERIAKLIEDNFGNHVAFKYLPGGSGVKQDLLLFVASGTDKVHAIKELQEYYGIPQERIMYFGDNTNDLKAIKYAGVGVAVESGKDHVKSEADMIAEGSNHDGAVGKFILKLLEK
jgi:HAD superfamily hydrolase (TIGR01484 family)